MTLEERFEKYHERNPHIYRAFRHYAFQAIAAGRKHLGVGLIAERIRWDTVISGDDGFKINNNYRAFYARKFMEDYPEFKGFFRTRRQVSLQ